MSTKATRRAKARRTAMEEYKKGQSPSMEEVDGHEHIFRETAEVYRAKNPEINSGTNHRDENGCGFDAVALKEDPFRVYICKPGVVPSRDTHGCEIPYVFEVEKSAWGPCATPGCDCDDSVMHINPRCHAKGVQVVFYREDPGTAAICCSECDHAVRIFELKRIN